MVRHRQKQSGFSMIEVLIALTIFAIGLLSIAGMQITAIQANSRGGTLSAATAVAEGILEDILSWDPADAVFAANSAAPVPWDFDPIAAGDQLSVVLDGGGTYQATYTITANTPVSNVSLVTIAVTGTRNLTLVGYKRYVD